jgi:hypothetical protein
MFNDTSHALIYGFLTGKLHIFKRFKVFKFKWSAFDSGRQQIKLVERSTVYGTISLCCVCAVCGIVPTG